MIKFLTHRYGWVPIYLIVAAIILSSCANVPCATVEEGAECLGKIGDGVTFWVLR